MLDHLVVTAQDTESPMTRPEEACWLCGVVVVEQTHAGQVHSLWTGVGKAAPVTSWTSRSPVALRYHQLSAQHPSRAAS